MATSHAKKVQTDPAKSGQSLTLLATVLGSWLSSPREACKPKTASVSSGVNGSNSGGWEEPECDECCTTAGESASEVTSSESSSEDERPAAHPGPAVSLAQPLPVSCSARMRARLSPLLAKILRHTASSWGLTLADDGFVSVEEVVRLPPLVEIGATLRDVEHVVEWERQDAKKQRFALRHGPQGVEIRANQGHSDTAVHGAALASAAGRDDLPPTLVHGTYLRCLDQIMAEGLRPMGRNHIHLFIESEGVGRRDAEVLVHVNVAQAVAAGIEFLRSENGVVLSTGGPMGTIQPSLFRQVTRARDGAVISSASGALTEPGGPAPKKYTPPHLRAAGAAGAAAAPASVGGRPPAKPRAAHASQRRTSAKDAPTVCRASTPSAAAPAPTAPESTRPPPAKYVPPHLRARS